MNLNQIIDILDTNGFDEALQSLCQVEGHDHEIRLYAVWCARQVQHLLSDKRSIDALDVSAQFATGFATAEELASAHVAAEAAAGFAIGAAAGAAGADEDDQLDAADASRVAQEKRLREVCAEIDAAIA